MVIHRSYDELAGRLAECLNSLAGDNKLQDNHLDVSVLRQWGLDSEDGVDLAADMEAALGIQIPHDENPLVVETESGQRRARTFKEVVEYLLGFVERQGQ